MFSYFTSLFGASESEPKPIRSYGWKKDKYTDEQLASRPALSTYKKLTYHPSLNDFKYVDLRSKCPQVYDQGKLGSCTANSTCAAYCFEMMKQGEPCVEMSRLYLYYCSREMEGNVDQDSGAELKDVIYVTENTGMCIESLWPYDITKFSDKPTDVCYEDSKLHKTIKGERIQQTDNDLKQCLVDGFPVVFGFSVYESFETEQVAKTGIVPMPDTNNEKLLGGHAVMLVGFTQIDGQDYYIVRNSWGTEWGDKGYFYMRPEYLTNTTLSSDFWSIQLVKDIKDPNETLKNEHLETLKIVKKILNLNEECPEDELLDELMNVAVSSDLLKESKKKINELNITIKQMTDLIRDKNSLISELKDENDRFEHFDNIYLSEQKDTKDIKLNKSNKKKLGHVKQPYNMDAWRSNKRPIHKYEW